jgi:hypothetical protein
MESPANNRSKVWWVVASLCVMMLIGGWGLNFFYKDALRNQVITALNARLKVKVDVKDIDFTIFSSFPYAAVKFSDIKINQPDSISISGALLTADRISFRFRLWDLFSGDVQLTGVEVSKANIQLYRNRKGQVNYDIFKGDTASASGLKVNLSSITVHDLKLSFVDKQLDREIYFDLADAEMTGAFSQSVFMASFKGEFDETSVRIGKVVYIDRKSAEVDASFSVDSEKGLYDFQKSTIKLAGMTFELQGKWVDHGVYDDINLSFSSKDADISSLISLLPSQWTHRFSKFNCSGELEFKGRLKGRNDPKNTPVFSIDFVARNASANPEGTSYKITALNGKGSFTSRKSYSAPYEILELTSISALMEGAPFKLDLRLENFANPSLDFSLRLDADLAILGNFYKPDTVESVSGSLSADVKFNGIANEKSTYKSNGSLVFKNASFKLKNSPIGFNQINGSLFLRENDVVVENLQAKFGSSDFLFSGNFNNLVAYLLLDRQPLDVKASMRSEFINLDDFFFDASSEQDSSGISLPDLHQFALDVSISQLKFRKFLASNIAGAVELGSSRLASRGLSFNSCGGQISLDGSIDGRLVDGFSIMCNSQIRNVDITLLFQQMGNFGQSTLVDKNLKGRVSANVELRSLWDKRLNLDDRSMVVKSDISIENGELIQFKPMLALSKYLKGSDLETIKFSNLTNTIEIRERKIIIPVMDIRSTALDLTASGTHTFDNVVDYRLGLYLSQILGKKVKKLNTEFGTIEDDGLGRPRIYLSMKGPAADPKFSWDRKGTEQKISDEIRKERNTIRDLLKKEFGKKQDEEDGIPVSPSQADPSQKELQLETDE